MRRTSLLAAAIALGAAFGALAPAPAEAQRRNNCLRSMWEMNDAEFQRCEQVRARASVQSGQICTKKLGRAAPKARMDDCIRAEFTRLIR